MAGTFGDYEIDNLTALYNSYDDYEYDIFMYSGFSFERPIYLYIWEFLVIFVSLTNLLVISVLLRKTMRTPTNMILAAIAITDSLTGIVTLPTYIMVYKNSQAVPTPYEMQSMSPEMTDITIPFPFDRLLINVSFLTAGMAQYKTFNMTYGSSYLTDDHFAMVQEGYELTKGLCTAFMITKFFLSKVFHTISIYLTLFLCIQRYMSIAYPFRVKRCITNRNTVIVCTIICLVSPILHVYHLLDKKANDGMCEWNIDNCKGDCVFLWTIMLVRHLIPCTLLTVFSVLFVLELRKSRIRLSNQKQSRRRADENRRISTTVLAIVVIFLVPEIPFGIFLLYSVITMHAGLSFNLETNRAIHAGYEIMLVLSFHANIYVYTFLNKRFSKGLKHTVLYPIWRAMGRPISMRPGQSLSSRSQETDPDTNAEKNGNTAMRMKETGAPRPVQSTKNMNS